LQAFGEGTSRAAARTAPPIYFVDLSNARLRYCAMIGRLRA